MVARPQKLPEKRLVPLKTTQNQLLRLSSLQLKSSAELVRDDNENRGRPVAARSEENLAEAMDIVQSDPNISHRRLSQAISVSKGTAHRMMKKDLNLFPYKIQLLHHIPETADEERFEFAQAMIEKMELGEIDFSRIIFSDYPRTELITLLRLMGQSSVRL